MKDKKELLIYQYEDGDLEKFIFLKNCYDINKKKYLFHAELYDVFRGVDNEDETFSVTRIGNNKRIKKFKKGSYGR
jgi:hypothetical protein